MRWSPLLAVLVVTSCASERATVTPGGLAQDKSREESREMVRQGWVTLEVPHQRDLASARSSVRNVSTTLGGWVQSERTEGLTLAIPSSRLEEALNLLEKDGHIRDRNITAVDVTTAHQDLLLRVQNARAFRDRLTQLVAQTSDVGKLLEIEKELARVTEQVELLQSQLKKMETDVAYARLDVNLEREVRPGPLGWVVLGAARGLKWLFVWE